MALSQFEFDTLALRECHAAERCYEAPQHNAAHHLRAVQKEKNTPVKAPPTALQVLSDPLYNRLRYGVKCVVPLLLRSLWVCEGGEQPSPQRVPAVSCKQLEKVKK